MGITELRPHSPEIIRATTAADSWFNAYLSGNKTYPQVRIGTQVLVTDELLNSTTNIVDYSLSRLSPQQIQKIGEEMSVSHHKYAVAVASLGSHNTGDTVVSSSRFPTLWHQDKIAAVNGLRQMIGLPPQTIFPDDNSINGLPGSALLKLHKSAQELSKTMKASPGQVAGMKIKTHTAKEILYGNEGQKFSIFYKMAQTSQYWPDRNRLFNGKNSSYWMNILKLDREVLFAMKTENLRTLPYMYFANAVVSLNLDPADYLWVQPQNPNSQR